ncbi:MAG: ATP-binding protein [Calditrichia bacterium]
MPAKNKPETKPVETLKIPSDLKHIEKVEKFSQKICKKMGLSEEQSDNMAIALTELAVNAMVHGNKEDPQKKVTIQADFEEDRLRVSITDEGGGFDPGDIPNPTNPQNLWKEHGRGIFLVQNLIDEVSFSTTPEGMKITLIEYRERS